MFSLNQVLILIHKLWCILYYQIGESYEVRAFTFKALTQVLKCAGDKKLKEVQLCLEGSLALMNNVCCAYDVY